MLKETQPGFWRGAYEDQLIFQIDLTVATPTAFIQTGHHLSHIALRPDGKNKWRDEWNLLLPDGGATSFYLSLDRFDDGSFGASTFFGPPSFHYMYGTDFQETKKGSRFRDRRSNIRFEALLEDKQIELEANFLEFKNQLPPPTQPLRGMAAWSIPPASI